MTMMTVEEYIYINPYYIYITEIFYLMTVVMTVDDSDDSRKRKRGRKKWVKAMINNSFKRSTQSFLFIQLLDDSS